MWTGNILVKGTGAFGDVNWDEIKKWPEVEAVWTTTGTWDWWVKLKPAKETQLDTVEKLVWNLRKKPWVAATETWWAKQC